MTAATRWHRAPMLALDTETTGQDPDTARLVTATLILINADGIGSKSILEWLVNPGCDIPAGATAVHGITTERAREDGQDARHAVYEITQMIVDARNDETPVVAFNAAYDFTVLDREQRRHGITGAGSLVPVVDPHVIDKAMHPYRKGKRTLTAVSEHYGIQLTDAHTSSGDALCAARVAYRLAETYPDDLQIPLTELHALQAGWRRDQAASLQTYFRKTNPQAVVNGDWPIQQLPGDWTPEQLAPADSSAA